MGSMMTPMPESTDEIQPTTGEQAPPLPHLTGKQCDAPVKTNDPQKIPDPLARALQLVLCTLPVTCYSAYMGFTSASNTHVPGKRALYLAVGTLSIVGGVCVFFASVLLLIVRQKQRKEDAA